MDGQTPAIAKKLFQKETLSSIVGNVAQILIVDDLKFMRDLLKDIVTDQGHMVIGEASNGREGILKFAELEPDIVLLDINMPEMDGIAALKKIRSLNPNALVIMCSALSEQAMIFKAISAGARDYIIKPFREERIYHALQKASLVHTNTVR